MIKEFVQRFEANKETLRQKFSEEHPSEYSDIVKAVIEIITSDGYDFNPDPERIHEINDGDYQGTLLYIIPEKGYQPSTYYAVDVSYGSCSGCDTLQAISNYDDGKPSEQQVNEYMSLALHIVQDISIVGGAYRNTDVQ